MQLFSSKGISAEKGEQRTPKWLLNKRKRRKEKLVTEERNPNYCTAVHEEKNSNSFLKKRSL